MMAETKWFEAWRASKSGARGADYEALKWSWHKADSLLLLRWIICQNYYMKLYLMRIISELLSVLFIGRGLRGAQALVAKGRLIIIITLLHYVIYQNYYI